MLYRTCSIAVVSGCGALWTLARAALGEQDAALSATFALALHYLQHKRVRAKQSPRRIHCSGNRLWHSV